VFTLLRHDFQTARSSRFSRRRSHREQKTDAFRQRMKVRNGIEGTQSELVRAHGMRRSRYRGKAKLDLQHQLIGAACNIKRWLRLMAWELKAKAAHALEAVVFGNGGMPGAEISQPTG
jgi:hypothetical protein